MGHAMMHQSGKGRFHDLSKMDISDMPTIPVPIAMAGALGSLMLGAGLGMMMGRKSASNGHELQDVQQRLDQLTAAKRHHHHGEGGMACGCKEAAEKAQEALPQ